jgi:hypothetical protein
VPLHKRCRAVESALNKHEGCTISLRLRCIRGISWQARRKKKKMSMKYWVTPSGIEPATFQFVAQHLNHRATAVPHDYDILYNISAEHQLC